MKLVLIGRELGHPNDEALAALMKNASVFLYPSWYEGFGLPLHEAARFGTPCIASTSGALPETAPQGTLFAPPTKPHLWVVAIQRVLHEPAKHRTQTALTNWQQATSLMATVLRTLDKNRKN
jgi:glycosyltransferase involved in cell wall biosynthesis